MKKIYFCTNDMFSKLILTIMVLMLSIAVMQVSAAEKVDGKTETKSKVSARHAMCKKVSTLIKNKMVFKFELASVNVPDMPRTDSFLNIDIDGDDISDKIIRGCGTSECELEIQLSGGGKIEFANGPFFIIRLGGQLYLLASGIRDFYGHIENPLFTLYLVDRNGVQEVCDTSKKGR